MVSNQFRGAGGPSDLDNLVLAVSFGIQVPQNEHSEVDMLWASVAGLLILCFLGFSM